VARDWLSDLELERLTRKRRGAAQSRALNALGIPHKRRLDGTVVVFRRDLKGGELAQNESVGGNAPAPSNGLNWSKRA
jgi:hypothetical protein